jgi:hypothetical protein
MCMYSVSPRQQGDPEGECCDVRLLLLRNEAATSEIIPALCIGRTKLIGNQLGLHVVYIASCIPSRRIKLPFALQQVMSPSAITRVPSLLTPRSIQPLDL